MTNTKESTTEGLAFNNLNAGYIQQDTLVAIEFFACLKAHEDLKDIPGMPLRAVMRCANSDILRNNSVLTECVASSGIYCLAGLKRIMSREDCNRENILAKADERYSAIMDACKKTYSDSFSSEAL